MSYTTQELLSLAEKFEDLAEASLVKSAKEKLDPKAKMRNRGTVCVPAESAKDKKDHFPINSIDQARNALARVHQYTSVPEWYKGSLKGLQSAVSRKVHSKYPAIGKEKKSSLEVVLSKYAEETPAPPPPNLPPPPAPAWQGVQNNEYAARSAIQNLQRTLQGLMVRLPKQGDGANYQTLQVLTQIQGMLQNIGTGNS